MADDKTTANNSPYPEGYKPQSRRERREMEEYAARLAEENKREQVELASSEQVENPRVDEARPADVEAASASAQPEATDSEDSKEEAEGVASTADMTADKTAEKAGEKSEEKPKDPSTMTAKERRKAKRAEQAELTFAKAREEDRLGEWAWVQVREGGTVVLYALIIAFLIKTFLLRGFYIPSGSMEQTLQVNDRVFINVAGSYFNEPKRGDVIVFKDSQGWIPSTQKSANPIKEGLSFVGILPDTSSNFLVKRVIGTPGDVVESDGNGKIKVNGVEINEPYLYPGNQPSELAFKVTVPKGKYFVMGDHRSNSADSRYHISDGTAFISKDDVQGNVFVVAWPLNHFGLLTDESSVFSSVPSPTSTPEMSERHRDGERTGRGTRKSGETQTCEASGTKTRRRPGT